MGAAAIPLMAVSTGVQIYGQIKSANAKADADAQNAVFLQRQADLAQDATDREASLVSQKYDQTFGNQVSAFARAGVDVSSGSPLLIEAQTRLQQAREVSAVREEGQFKVDEAHLRSLAALQDAADTKSALPWQIAGSLLTGGAAIANSKLKAGT